MQTHVLPNPNALADAVAGLIADCVRDKPASVLCLAGGDTPRAAYARLVEMQRAGEVDLSQVIYVGLDEWVGLPADYPGSCRAFMQETVFGPLAVPPERIVFYDAMADDLQAECRRVDAFLSARGPLDLVLLGMGMNGHLGMNEPGCTLDSGSIVTELDPVTVSVGQKYFGTQQPVLKQGITLGIGSIMQAHLAVLMVSGGKKAATVAGALQGDIGNRLPASLLRTHGNAIAMLDADAAQQLDLTRPLP
ncbi:6-phosphogluconolactonase [Jeongeupia naejangsanensis]|uniref:Glucosamine-6-phosphate deaminase n=1 Tax=Jeongeupia naejangsanensis TaxID=613195 RepID=A0ABS2BFF7_9NEIS|nr:glucosamine-6-phosphate deaminase [Jeongeupia naejangsanensis]MBM3114331.1 glucosamine-6-phosphate deaminase [Jeongeupia naejangsanensis]